MTVSNSRSMGLRGISLFVAIAFSITTLTGSPSLATASSGAFEGVSGVKAVPGIQKDLYAMPSELGSLVSLWEPSAGNDSQNFVVHIQDAHANPEGQQNIAAMLRYLEQKSPGLVIGLEGASGELHPEYLDFFKEYPEANRAAVEDLKKKGELNGAERFLLQKRYAGNGERETKASTVQRSPLANPAVHGIEDAGLYRKDLRLYRDLLAVRGEIERSFLPLRTKIEKESSRKLSGELRDFLRERSRRKEGRFDLASSATDADLHAYVRFLEKQTLKTLAIDLTDPLEQLRFPNLMRVVKIEAVRQSYDPKIVQAQWASVVSTLKKAAKDPGEKEFVKALAAFGRRRGFIAEKGNEEEAVYPSDPALYPRQLVEAFFRFSQKHQLSFSGQEAFWQSWKLVVFQAEIDVTGLLNEMDRLEGLLIEKLARSENEKTLVRKLGNLDLLEKMFRLELSRKEYDKALSGRRTLEALIKDSKSLVPSLAEAYEFYEVSLARDEALVANLLKIQDGGWRLEDGGKQLAASALRPPSSKLYVLYSGGFHTPGIEVILRQKGIGYAVLSPRMTSLDHGEMYQKAMDGDNADLSAYFKVKNPFLTKQEALLFKQLIETAAPVLSEKYKLSPDQVAARVSQAVQEHPVLSEVVVADQQKPTNPSVVNFQPRPDLQALIPQNSSAMPRANLCSPVEARSDVRVNDLRPGFVSNISFSSAQALRLDIAPSGSAVSVRSEARQGGSAANALAEELEKVAEGKITPSESDWLSLEAKIEKSLGLSRESARDVMDRVMQPLIPVAPKEKIDRLFDPDFIPGTFMVGERLKNPKFLSPGDNANLRKWVNAQIASELARWKHQFENEESAADRARYEKIFGLIQAKETEWGMPLGDAIFMLFFLKTAKGARFVDTIPNQIYQDVLARSISMLVSGSPYNNPFADKGFNEKLGKVMEEILPRLAGLSLEELFRYSIASGAMGLDLKSNASAASIINVNNIIPYYAEGETDVARPSRMFDQLKLKAARPLAIDFWPEFEEQFVRAKTAKTLLFFHDDYGETQIDLLFIQKLLEENPKLTVISVPRSGPPGPSGYLRFGNDASSMDFPEFLSRDVFRSLARKQKEGHFQFSSKGPTWGAVSGKEFSEEVADLVLKSAAIVVKGARSYEMLQGINKDAYFAYMVCREFSESVTGVDSNTGLSVFIKQEAGLPSFQGFRERNTHVRELFDTGRKGWTTPMTAADYAEAVHSKTYAGIVQRLGGDKLFADRWIKNRSAESGVTFSEWILSQGRSDIGNIQDQTAVWREELENELRANFAHEVNPVAERIVQEHRLPSGAAVLSLGSGRGRDEIFFAKNGYHVTATDFIPEALTVIRDSAAREGVGAALETKLQDLTQPLAFADASFEMVYAHLSLHYFEDPALKAIIREIFRVLKPGGQVALTVRSVEDWKFQDALSGRSRGKVFAGDFLETDGKKQRFFTERSLGDLWEGFESVAIEKKPFQRLVGQPVSTVLELFATKPVARSEVRPIAEQQRLLALYSRTDDFEETLDITSALTPNMLASGVLPASFPLPGGKMTGALSPGIGIKCDRVLLTVSREKGQLRLHFFGYRGGELHRDQAWIVTERGLEAVLNDVKTQLEQLYTRTDDFEETLDITSILSKNNIRSGRLPKAFPLPRGQRLEQFSHGAGLHCDRVEMTVSRENGEWKLHFFGYKKGALSGERSWRVTRKGLEPVVNDVEKELKRLYSRTDDLEETLDITSLLSSSNLRGGRLPQTFPLPIGQMQKVFSYGVGLDCDQVKVTVIRKSGEWRLHFYGYRHGVLNRDQTWRVTAKGFEESPSDIEKELKELYTRTEDLEKTLDITSSLTLSNLESGMLPATFPLPDGKTVGRLSPGFGKNCDQVKVSVSQRASEWRLHFFGYKKGVLTKDQAWRVTGDGLETVSTGVVKELKALYSRTDDFEETIDITLLFHRSDFPSGRLPYSFPLPGGKVAGPFSPGVGLGCDQVKVTVTREGGQWKFHFWGYKNGVLQSDRAWRMTGDGLKAVLDDAENKLIEIYSRTEDFEETLDITALLSSSDLQAGKLPKAFRLPGGQNAGYFFPRIGTDCDRVTMAVTLKNGVWVLHFFGYKNGELSRDKAWRVTANGLVEVSSDVQIDSIIEKFRIADIVADLGDHPDVLAAALMLMTQIPPQLIQRIVARTFKGLRERTAPVDRSDYTVVPEEAQLDAYPAKTGEMTLVLEGIVPAGFSHVLLQREDSERLVQVSKGGVFKARIMLRRGKTLELMLYGVDDEAKRIGKPVKIKIRQTSGSKNVDEILSNLLAKRADVIEKIRQDPHQMAYLTRKLEVSLMKQFTQDEARGFEYLEKHMRETPNQFLKMLYGAILKKFREIAALEIPGFRYQTNGESQRLFFYQKYAIQELLRRRDEAVKAAAQGHPVKDPGVILAMEQGLGKTLVVLSAVREHEEGALIVTPNPVLRVWGEQEGRFFEDPGLMVADQPSSVDKVRALEAAGETPKVVPLQFLQQKTYGRFEAMNRNPQQIIALDEAHFLGKTDTNQTKGAKDLKGIFKILVTATPFSKAEQLRPVLAFLNPGTAYQDADIFKQVFSSNDPDSFRLLHFLLGQYVIRIKKSDVFEEYDPNIPLLEQKDRLPRKTYVSPEDLGAFELTEGQAEGILRLFTNWDEWSSEQDGRVRSEDDAELQRRRSQGDYFSRHHSLRQLMNDPSYAGVSGESPKHLKMDRIVDEEVVRLGGKVLIFTRYRGQVSQYAKRYAKHGVVTFYGDTGIGKSNAAGNLTDATGKELRFRKKNDYEFEVGKDGKPIPAAVGEKRASPMTPLDHSRFLFQNDPATKVMITTYNTGSLGVTLTAANAVIEDDLPQSFIEGYQAEERADRIDNERKKVEVRYYRLMAKYPEKFLARMKTLALVRNKATNEKKIVSEASVTRGDRQDDNLDIKNVYETYFRQGSFDEVLFRNLEAQRAIFELILDNYEEDLVKQRISEEMPFLFGATREEVEADRLDDEDPAEEIADNAAGRSSSPGARSEARSETRKNAELPRIDFFNPSPKTLRLTESFMKQALREKAVDPLTGRLVDLNKIAKDVSDLNRVLLSQSGEQLKELCRKIIEGKETLLISGTEKVHDLTGLKWQLTQSAHELLVRKYRIYAPGGFGRDPGPILMISEIIAEMYFKKRIAHHLPAPYAAFQPPTAVAGVADAVSSADPKTSQPRSNEARRSELREGMVKAAAFGIGDWFRSFFKSGAAQTPKSEPSLQLPLDPKMRLRLIEQMREASLITGAIIPEASSKIWDSFFEDFEVFLGQISKLNFTRPIKTILIAEDEDGYQREHRRAFEKLGRSDLEIIYTHDGIEAFEYMKEHPGTVDLILTDVDMPTLDSREREAMIANGYSVNDVNGDRFMQKVRMLLHEEIPAVFITGRDPRKVPLVELGNAILLSKTRFTAPVFVLALRALLQQSEKPGALAPQVNPQVGAATRSEARVSLAMLRAMHREATPGTESAYWAGVGKFHDRFRETGVDTESIDDPRAKELSKFTVYPEMRSLYLQRMQALLSRLPEGMNDQPRQVISIGLGDGSFEKALMDQLGVNVAGFELSPVLADRAREKGIQVFGKPGEPGEPAEIGMGKLADASQDVVLINEAMGYLDPARIFQEAFRVLRPGGIVLILQYPVTAKNAGTVSQTGYVYYPFEDFALEQGKVLEGLATGLKAVGFSESGTDSLLTRDLPKDSKFLGFFPNRQSVMDFHWAQKPFSARVTARSEVRERWTTKGKVSRSLTVLGRVAFLPKDTHDFQWSVTPEGMKEAQEEFLLWLKQIHSGMETLLVPILARHLKDFIRAKVSEVQSSQAKDAALPGTMTIHPIAALLAALQDGIAKGEVPRLKGKEDEKKILNDYFSDTARLLRLQSLIAASSKDPVAGEALLEKQFEVARLVIERNMAEQEESLHGIQNRLMLMDSTVASLAASRKEMDEEESKDVPDHDRMSRLQKEIDRCVLILGEQLDPKSGKRVNTKKLDLEATLDRIESYIHMLKNELLPKVQDSKGSSHRAKMEGGAQTLATLFFYPKALFFFGFFKKVDQTTDFGRNSAQGYFDTAMFVRDIVVAQVEAIERELLSGSPKEEISERGLSDGNIKGLLVRRNASTGEIMRALELLGKELGFLVASKVSQNAHWVQIVRGRSFAPPILFLSEVEDKDNLDKLVEGQEILLKGDDQSGEGELVASPNEKDLKDAEIRRQNERYLSEGEKRLAEYPLDTKVGINMSTGDEPGNPALSGAVNSSLIRTDILAEKTKKHIAEVMAALASGEFNVSGWLTLLRDLKISNLRSQEDVKLLLGQFILVLQKNGMPSIRGLLGNLRSVYGPFIRHPFFEGNYEPFRTLDLQNDSKNKDVLALLEDIHAKHPEAGLMRYPEGHNPQSKSKKWITGFNFYRNSSLGQFLLIWQLTALLIEYTHYLEAGGVSDPARLAPLFPMVATPEDLDFIKTQILPFAQKLAALNLRTDVQWSPESLKKAEQQVERAARKVSYGMMLEVMPILENPVLMDQMIERPDVEFYDVGTNDLEKELWEEEVRKILKALGKSTDEDLENFELPREVEEAQHLYGSLHPRLMRGLDTFARKLAVYNAKHPGKEKRMCICGQLGGSLKFLSMVERWRRMGVPVSVSVGFEEVRQVRHTFLRYRQVPKEVLDYVASDPELIDLRAGELSSAMMRQSMDFLKTSEEFQTRYARLGYYHGFYQDSMDPENGVGSFRDIVTIKKLFRSLVPPGDLHSLELSPEDDVSDAELARILAYLGKKDPFLGRGDRSFADAKSLESLRAASRFLRDAREVFREVHQITSENQDLPEKKGIVLHTGNLSEFIDAFEKRFPRESQAWLSRAGEAKRQEEFFSRYYDSANVVFTQVTGMMHEGFEHLFGAETEELGLVTEFPSELRTSEKEKTSGKEAIPLLIWKRMGMVFKREIGFVYREIRELHIPEAFEKAALTYFMKDPASMLEVFKHAIADRRNREIRIAYPLQRILRQATALASSEGDLRKVAKGFREFFSSRHDISYSLWRLHRFGFFSKFFPSFAAMRNYFPGDGRRSPVHIQTLNAMEFLERLGDVQDFAFVRAGNVLKEIKKEEEGLMLLRLTLFMLGIVRARLKLKTGDVPNSGEIRAILNEVLVEKMDFGLSSDQLERMTWLISKERQLNGNELITSREIVAALKRIFFDAGENVTQGQLDMLYLLTFSMRAGRADHEKLVMLKRQGPDSALANCDKFYVAGRSILKLRLAEGNLKSLVRDTQEVVRRGLWGSDRPMSILADENSTTVPSIKRKFNEAWGDFKELSPETFESHRRNLGLQEGEAGLLKLSLEELRGDSGKFLELLKRYEDMVSPYYLETLDRKTLVAQLVFFAHLQQLQSREDSEPIVLFSPLAHHYSNAFEISIGRALEDPGLIALYSRILFQNGFLIESTTVQREAGAGGKYVVRFMGSLPHGGPDANKVIEKIVKDFEAIFYIPGKHPYTATMSLRERLVRRFYFYVRPILAKHLLVKDRAITAGFFRNAYERFGDFTVRQEPSVGAVASTTLDFLPQLSDRDFSRLVIRTRDRRGLIAFVATYISQIQKLDIVDFYFDDTMGRNPRMILDIAQKEKKGVLTDRQKGTIVTELKEKLDAFEVGIHRVQIFNRYELTTVDEKPVVPSVVPQRAPESVFQEVPAIQPLVSETPQKTETPSVPEKEERTAPAASVDPLRVRSYKIATPFGLHNLPSALVARSFKRHPKVFGGTMTHLPSGTSVSMKEQFALMTLGAEQGHDLKVEIDLAPDATPEEVEAFWTYLETDIKDPEKPDAASSASKIPIFQRQEVRSELREAEVSALKRRFEHEYKVTGKFGLHIGPSKSLVKTIEAFSDLVKSAELQYSGFHVDLLADSLLPIFELQISNGATVKIVIVPKENRTEDKARIEALWSAIEGISVEENKPLFARLERLVSRSSIAPVKPSSEPVGILASRQYRLAVDIGPKYATWMAGVVHRYYPMIVSAFFEKVGHSAADLTRELEVLTADGRRGDAVEIRVIFKRETPAEKISEFWDSLERLSSKDEETEQPLLTRVPGELLKRELPEAPVLDLEQFVTKVAMKWVDGQIVYAGNRSPEYGNATPLIVASDLLRRDIQLYLLRGKRSPLVEELQHSLKLSGNPEAQKEKLRELQALLEQNIRKFDLARLLASIESLVPSTVSEEGAVVSGKIPDLPVTLVMDRTNVSRNTVGAHTTSSIEINETVGGITKLQHVFIGVDCDFLNRTLERVLGERVSSRVSEPSPADALAQVSGSTAALTSEVEKAFTRSEVRNLVEKWVPRAEALKAAAKELGVYSEAGITLAVRDPRKARLWIALKIIEEMSSGESRLENNDLQSVATKIFASLRGIRNVADRNVAGVDFHANFSGLSDSQWSELARNFPVVLALLISLHARLSINVDVPERELERIRQKFEALLTKEGISMDSKQFRFVSSFKKTPFESFKSGKADALFARDRELVKSHNRNVSTRWFETSTDMKQLAAGLATALLYVASDKKPDSLEPLEPSKYEAVLKAVVSAIAGYALIQKAA